MFLPDFAAPAAATASAARSAALTELSLSRAELAACTLLLDRDLRVLERMRSNLSYELER